MRAEIITFDYHLACPECGCTDKHLLFPLGRLKYDFTCLECGASDRLQKLGSHWTLLEARLTLKPIGNPNPDGDNKHLGRGCAA